VLDSGWEGELCRILEKHPRVRRYVKNQGLGFEVPYTMYGEARQYRPDFLVAIEDGHGEDDLLNLVVEVKGYRHEDAKDKKSTMETYWVPGVNRAKRYGRWGFAELREVFAMEADLEAAIAAEVETMLDGAMQKTGAR
jgi:type III restriction enzyme